jgi:hypothetical protein
MAKAPRAISGEAPERKNRSKIAAFIIHELSCMVVVFEREGDCELIIPNRGA